MKHDQHWMGPVASKVLSWTYWSSRRITATLLDFETLGQNAIHGSDQAQPGGPTSMKAPPALKALALPTQDTHDPEQDLHDSFVLGRAQGSWWMRNFQVEPPQPTVPLQPKFLPIQTAELRQVSEPDSWPGLRGIVRIAKLRPSALVSVVFAGRSEMISKSCETSFGDPACPANFSSFKSVNFRFGA